MTKEQKIIRAKVGRLEALVQRCERLLAHARGRRGRHKLADHPARSNRAGERRHRVATLRGPTL
jgi:hypothetical protein